MKILDGLFISIHTTTGEDIVGHSDYTSLDDLREHMMRDGAWLRIKEICINDSCSPSGTSMSETIDEYNIKCDKIVMWKTTYEV